MKSYDLIIKEGHLDTFGHVNNATYLEIFEEARWEVLNEKGVTVREIQQSKKGPVLLNVNLGFKKEIFLRTKIKVISQMLDIKKNKIMVVKQTIINEKDDVCAEATFEIGLMDLNFRKLIPLTDLWVNLFS
tara:strand:+ start:51 stop:443 length:393 start_codon:yes stop_codon:yes gene_type:complete